MTTFTPAGASIGRAGTSAAPAVHRAAGFGTIAGAFALYLCWTLATYLLEGRSVVLLRPGAVRERMLYVVVANLAIGTLAAGVLLRRMIRVRAVTTRHAGFAPFRTSVAAVLIGTALGFGLYVVQGPPTLEPVVLLNGFAQAVVVSTAEVLVCWSVVGAVLESALAPRLGRWATPAAALAAAVLFGVYHYAHSPPFNTLGAVTLLTFVGLMTGAFFFAARDVYGTIVFHNFLALFGVLRALEGAGRLDAYTALQPALAGSAIVGIVVLVAVHTLCVRKWVPGRRRLHEIRRHG